MSAADKALRHIANVYADAYNQANQIEYDDCQPINTYGAFKVDPFSAFFKIHGGKITITWVNYLSDREAWGYGGWFNAIRIYKDAPLDRMSQENDSNYPSDMLSGGRLGRFITHEMGHVFENAYDKAYHTKPGRNMVANTSSINNRDGFASNAAAISWLQWQWSQDTGSGEIFADMFVGWVYDHWMKKPTDKKLLPKYEAGVAKLAIMNKNMPIWITNIIGGRR